MSVKNKKILLLVSVPLILGVLLVAGCESITGYDSKEIIKSEESSGNASNLNKKSGSEEDKTSVGNNIGDIESTYYNKDSLQEKKSSNKDNTLETIKLDENKSQEKNNISAQNITSSRINYKDKIDIDGNVSEDLIELLNDELNKIPSFIMSKYFDIGGKIILTSYDIATTYYNDYTIGSLMELHDARKQILYISARDKAIKEGAIHGVGHVFDSMTGWTSYKTNEFINIFSEEKNTIKTVDGGSYHKTNEKEYFAEAFYSFVVNPSVTRSSAPKTVNFLENLMSKL